MKRRIGNLSTHKERRLKHKEAWRMSVYKSVKEGNASISSQIALIEAHGGRKDWPDLLIDAANKPPPEKELSQKEKTEWLPERILRARLKTVVRFKHGMIPRKVLNELETVYRKTRVGWHPGSHLFTYTMPQSYRMSESTLDIYLSELAFRLHNRAWVDALRECAAGCGKLLLSLTKWENRYCSEECQPARKRISARKTRRRAKREKNIDWEGEKYKGAKAKLFKCPGNPDDPLLLVELTPTECINPDGKNIQGKWYACSTCPNFKKKGGTSNDMAKN